MLKTTSLGVVTFILQPAAGMMQRIGVFASSSIVAFKDVLHGDGESNSAAQRLVTGGEY